MSTRNKKKTLITGKFFFEDYILISLMTRETPSGLFFKFPVPNQKIQKQSRKEFRSHLFRD